MSKNNTICSKSPNKKRYNSEKEAAKAVSVSDNPFGLTYYGCDVCCGWHLTSVN